MTISAAADVELAAAVRRLTTTRAILERELLGALHLATECRKSHLYGLAVQALDYAKYVAEAFAEVDAAERGCGHANGDCTCPCHLT